MSNEAKHTPAQWRIASFEQLLGDELIESARSRGIPYKSGAIIEADGSIKISSDDGLVCVVKRKTHCKQSERATLPCDERDANARLIAAAPDLLSCLQGVLDSLTQNKTFPADIENARRLARIGIAKATGGA